jgi:hypothetical protein
MPQITPFLAVEPFENGLTGLLITDAYGHINGRIDLTPEQARALSDRLQTLAPIEVEAVVVESEVETGVDWEALTKAEIIDKVNELYDILLDADDTKAKLVAQAKDLEAQLA